MGKRKVHMSPPAANPRDVEDRQVREAIERCQIQKATRLDTSPDNREK
jgi:hypothetical protein